MEKIRRNQKLFRKHPKRSPLKIILFILLCALAVFIGYSAAGPLYHFFTGDLQTSSSSEVSSEASLSSSLPESSESSSEPEQTPSSSADGIRALCFTADELASDTQSVIDMVQDSGANAVLVEIKSEDGLLTYASTLETAQTAGAVPTDAPDLKTALSKLKAENISAIAKMSCFKDPLAHNAVKDGIVLYAPNHNIMWLDNTAAAGGKSWLNPYAQSAWQYLSSIAKEAVSDGFSSIMLSEVQFPNRQSSKAYFGEEADTKSRETILTEFVAYMETQVEAAGGDVILSVPAKAATGSDVTVFGENPLTFQASTVAIDLREDSVTLSDGSTVSLSENPASALNELMTEFAATAGSGTTLAPWLSCDSSSLQIQISALEARGIENMIFYSEDSDYRGISVGTN